MNNTTTTDDRIITLIRGLPGSGKSTLARSSIFNGALLFEADMFHIRGGNYYFDSDRAADAHAWCLNQFTRAVVEATSDVIVANTFRKISDIIPYLNVARTNNIKIRVNTERLPRGIISDVWVHIAMGFKEPYPVYFQVC